MIRLPRSLAGAVATLVACTAIAAVAFCATLALLPPPRMAADGLLGRIPASTEPGVRSPTLSVFGEQA